MNQKYSSLPPPVIFPILLPFEIGFFLKMSNSHCAAHWRSCVSFARWIWSLSQSSFSLWLQEQKIYCRGIWPEDNFILGERQRVMGRRRKKTKQNNTTQPNKKTPEQTKKGDFLDAHSRFFGDMQVADFFTLNIVSDWRNEEQQRINDAAYISSNF